MTVSVPQVRSVEDMKWQIAGLLEDSLKVYRATGDIAYFEKAVQLARRLYDEELKLAGNKGTMDWGYIDRCRQAIEKIESIILRMRTRAR